MNTKEKILQFLDFKETSQGKFCRKIGVSNGFLTSGKHIGSEKLKIIRDNYVDLNMNWLIYDEGEMIINENVTNEHDVIYDKSSNENKRISKGLTEALKDDDLNDTFRLLIKEYVTLEKKHNRTQGSLTGLQLGYNELKKRIDALTNE